MRNRLALPKDAIFQGIAFHSAESMLKTFSAFLGFDKGQLWGAVSWWYENQGKRLPPIPLEDLAEFVVDEAFMQKSYGPWARWEVGGGIIEGAKGEKGRLQGSRQPIQGSRPMTPELAVELMYEACRVLFQACRLQPIFVL
jgi:hypothetical protein